MAKLAESVGGTETAFEYQVNGVTKLSVRGDGALLDSNGLNRAIFNPTAKTIVDGAATTLFTVPIATSTVVGGTIQFMVHVSDGTDFQALSGYVSYSSVNKAGTLTNAITQLATTEAKAVSGGTLTLAWTMAEDTADVVSIKLQPTGSLTETTFTVTYTVQPLRGTVTIV